MVEGEKKKKKKAAQQYPPFWLHEQSLFTVLYTYILCVSVCTILYIYYIEYLSLSLSLSLSKQKGCCGPVELEWKSQAEELFIKPEDSQKPIDTSKHSTSVGLGMHLSGFMIVIARTWMCMIHILRGRSAHFVPRWPLLLKNYSKLLVRQDMARLTSVETTMTRSERVLSCPVEPILWKPTVVSARCTLSKLGSVLCVLPNVFWMTRTRLN